MARFSPQFLDEIRARLRASDVIGKHIKLRREGREFRGLSPFTTEKTPSFFVNDQKARYFDFSSGKSGDIIGFMMDARNMSFPEAVEHLADLAGVPMPEESDDDRDRIEKAKSLAEACLEAARFFRTQLSRRDGEAALSYLDQRGVSETARKRFGLGFAPNSRTALKDHLLNKDYPLDVLVDAGLLIAPEDGSPPYDRFRDRIIYPILGTRGRVIAFGGRAMAKDAKAKYLNSPETPLFHKSHTLYNLDAARKLAHSSKRSILVAEGYMDVIALSEAGWPAVAPLGTALTEHQLGLLWRSEDRPILCFDGDRAGRSAAYRAMDRALPILTPGKSLRFAFLPDGQDPDDLIRDGGVSALEPILGEAQPLVDVLWEHLQDLHPRSTPEEAAAFRRELRDRVKQIADSDVRQAYGDHLAARFQEERPRSAQNDSSQQEWSKGGGGGNRGGGGGRSKWRPFDAPTRPMASPELKARQGARPSPRTLMEATLAIGLANHPFLFQRFEEEILTLELADPGLQSILSTIINAVMADPDLDNDKLRSHIQRSSVARPPFDHWGNHPQVRLERFLRVDTPPEKAERGWLNTLAKYRYQTHLETEMTDAAADAHRNENQERAWRDAVSHRSKVVADTKSDDDEDE